MVNIDSCMMNSHSCKSGKSVHDGAGIAVHIQRVWMFTLGRNQCSRWAGICTNAAASQKGKKDRQVAKYEVALSKISKLYKIEREIKSLSQEEKYTARQARSIPALQDIKIWLDANVSKIDKKSKTGESVRYAINQWPTLTTYCNDGRLNISNIEVERAIRRFAQGRRPWLFADTPKGAKASAVLYSMIESAKTNDLEPYAYL